MRLSAPPAPKPVAVDVGPAVVPGHQLDAIDGAIDVIAAVIDPGHRRHETKSESKWGLYWESHRVWREFLNNRLKKKKTKALKPRPHRAGFYYENHDDFLNWKAAGDIDAHYKPRVLLDHQHVSHDRIHDNIDIHTGHHMLEAYVHVRATRKNVLYLAHILKEQTGRLYTIGDNHKPKFLMDIHGTERERDIAARFPKRKPFAVLLRYHHHHEHGFTGGSLWKSPEYQEYFMNHPAV